MVIHELFGDINKRFLFGEIGEFFFELTKIEIALNGGELVFEALANFIDVFFSKLYIILKDFSVFAEFEKFFVLEKPFADLKMGENEIKP